jgi:LmbE family N-acetylglucosaminyl deacetylase
MRTLCAVFAHPDDETFSLGGALARYADEGVEISLVTATSGEAGEIAAGLEVDRDDLAAWRERELHEAAEVLGIRHVRLLGLPDGGLEGRGDDLEAGIQAALRELRPQVVVTENAQGITGHPDHMAMTRAVVRAFDGLPDSGMLKLYENAVPLRMATDGRIGTPEDFITTRMNVEAWRPRIMAAFRAHRSQVDAATLRRFAGYPPPWTDYLVCVRSRVPICIPEDDLFQGIDAGEPAGPGTGG